MTHPRLGIPAGKKPTNGANGRCGTALLKDRRQPQRARERRGAREEESPFVEKSRAWVLALRGGVVLSLATFALVAASQGLSKPHLQARGPDTVAHSFAFVPADLSDGAAATPWPLEDEPGSQGGAPQALPDSAAEEGKAEPTREEAGSTVAEGETTSRSVRRATRERRPQGPSATRSESGDGSTRIASGARRRTSVAIEEEKIVSKPAAPKPRVLTTEPEVTFRPKPVYSPAAIKDDMEGTVRVKFLVTTTGSVKNLEVLWAQPPGLFEEAVKEAVSQWRFVPGKDQDGKPMEAEQIYTYRFQLEAAGG